MKKINATRAAAIDIGTNSMRLLLCQIEGERLKHKTKELIVTRIGKGVSGTGMLSEQAISRNVEALKYFGNKSKNHQTEKIIAIATSAVRDAANREVFIKRAKEEAGIDVLVITGKEEAELGILGAMSEVKDADETVLVIDIGGGSTELILGSKNSIKFATSINAGTVRMTESFVSSNPIPDSDISQMEQYMMNIFQAAFDYLKNEKIDKIIGIGGTATTTAAMHHKLCIYQADKVHNSIISYESIDQMLENIRKMNISERYGIKGLQKERADVAPAGLCILRLILKELNAQSITISENDNLEGAVIKYLL